MKNNLINFIFTISFIGFLSLVMHETSFSQHKPVWEKKGGLYSGSLIFDFKVNHKGDILIYFKTDYYNTKNYSKLFFYNINSKSLDSLDFSDNRIIGFAISPGDSLIALLKENSEIEIISMETKMHLKTLLSLDNLTNYYYYFALAFNQYSNQLTVIGTYVPYFYKIDIENDKILSGTDKDLQIYNGSDISSYGNYFATPFQVSSSNCFVSVYNTNTYREDKINIPNSRDGSVLCAITDDGSKLIYLNFKEGTLNALDIPSGNIIKKQVNSLSKYMAIDINDYSNRVLVKFDDKIRIYDLQSLTEISNFKIYPNFYNGNLRLNYSDNFETINCLETVLNICNITDHSGKTLNYTYHTIQQKLVKIIPEEVTGSINYLATDKSSKMIATSSEYSTMIWNACDGTIKTIIDNTGKIQFACGDKSIFILNGNNLYNYDIDSGDLINSFPSSDYCNNFLASSAYPVIIQQTSSHLDFRNIQTGAILSTYKFNGSVKVIRFDKPEEKLIAVIDDSLIVWELSGCTVIRREKLAQEIIDSGEKICDLSPDLNFIGTILPVNDRFGNCTIRELSNGKIFRANINKNANFKFNTDGRTAVIHSYDPNHINFIYNIYNIATNKMLNCEWYISGQTIMPDSSYETYLLMKDGRHIVFTDCSEYLGYFEICPQMITSVDNFINRDNDNIEGYPNPVSDLFNLKLPDELHQITNVRIANSIGIMADVKYLINSDGISINLAGFAPGIYFVILDTNEGRIVKKVMKN